MKNYFKIVKLMFTADRKLLVTCFLIVFMFLGIESFIPIFMDYTIHQMERNHNIAEFLVCVVFFALAYLVLSLMAGVRAKVFDYLGKHILWNTREKIYRVLWSSNYAKHVKNNKDRFKFVLATETYVVYAITTLYTVGALTNILTILAFLGISFMINPLVAIILIFAMFFTLGLSFVTGKKILAHYEKYEAIKETDVTNNYENVDLVEVIKTNGLIPYYLRKNRDSLDHFIQKSAQSNSISMFCEYLENAVHYIIYIVIAGVLVNSLDYSGGQLVTALFITNYLLEKSQDFQRQLQVIIKNIPVFDRVMDVAEIPVETGNTINKINRIEFQSVSLSYEGERNVFDNLSFCVETGDNVLIEGENGSGKSSILKMIVGLLEPTKGNILINGIPISAYDKNSLYKEINYVSQEENMLNESVEDYLRIITHTDISNEQIHKLRERVRFNPEINKIMDYGSNLSGGEKKKLLMIKSLMNAEVSVVIFDEIDAGLDVETMDIMKEIENELLDDKNKIVIKISHIDTDKRGYNKVIYM